MRRGEIAMKRTATYLIVIALMLTAVCSSAYAEFPISIQMSFNKPSYQFGEQVGLAVNVTNNTGRDLRITKGFCSKTFFLEMRVIDPAGRLILPDRGIPHDETPDAPPLAFCQKNDGSTTQVAPYEILPAGQTCSAQTNNLLQYYNFKFPGNYSFQSQVSAMVFNEVPGEPCVSDINNYEFLGTLKSETVYIHMQGGTDVDITPKQWSLSGTGDISAIIWPEPGKTVDDYMTQYIQLNDVAAKRVLKMYSSVKDQYYLLVFFDRQQSIGSLGSVMPGNEYNVVISGMHKTGQLFGGGEKITIIN